MSLRSWSAATSAGSWKLLDEHLDDALVEVRRLAYKLEDTMRSEEVLEEACDILTALRTPATCAQRAELALRWFESDITWYGRWDDHEGSPSSPRPDAKKLISEWRAELSDVET